MILLCLLAPFIISIDTIQVGYSGIQSIDNYKKSYQLVTNGVIQDYVHIIASDSNSQSNQILYFSSMDENCVNGRQLLSMNPNKEENVELFLTKSQIQENQSNFLCIECSSSQSCSFNLQIESVSSCVLNLNTQHTYYVFGNQNTKMKFTIKNDASISNTYITIWAKGKNQLLKSELSVSGAQKNNFGEGEIYSFLPQAFSTEFVLTVEAAIGDLVTVGSATSNSNFINQKVIYPNSLEVMGYIKKGYKEHECYSLKPKQGTTYDENIDVLFLNGVLFNKIGYTYYVNNAQMDKDHWTGQVEILDGNLGEAVFASQLITQNNDYYCITFNPDTDRYPVDELVFTIQLIDKKHKPGIPVRSPQTLGRIYSHYAFVGDLITFSSVQPSSRPKEINYNMKSVLGFPDMLFDECETYPKCNYEGKNPVFINNPRHANFMTTYSKYLQDNDFYSPISAKQPLMLVNCTDGSQKKTSGEGERQKANLCIFETSIFSDKDILTLREGDGYSQFLLKDEKDRYRISYYNEKKVTKIYLDLYILTGDVNFDIDSKLNVNKYYLANKIFYSITVNDPVYREVEFSVHALKNSFYTIQYQLVRSDDDSIKSNIIESGASYLQSIDLSWADKTKELYMDNIKSVFSHPFLVNFHSLNCKFTVLRKLSETDSREVRIADNYGQEIITNDDPSYYQMYKFTVEAIDSGITEYEKKLCMIYVSGIELEDTITGMEREISIPEGVPQQLIFEKNITRIKYAYHLADLNNSLIISFNLLDKAPYKVKIFIGYIPLKVEHEFSRNHQIILTNNDWESYCEAEELCNVIIDITLNKENMTNKAVEPKLETLVRQADSVPSYLQRNELRTDILNGNTFRYYFVDIGKGESGTVTINYRRGSGNIYGRIVKKNQIKADENANWRGLFHFPMKLEESIRYEPYFKQLVINSGDTQDCDMGCYLLITVKSSNIREGVDTLASQPFSIMTRIFPMETANSISPKVKIPINEYVIGNVRYSQNITEYYDVWLPFDAGIMYIDWQGTSPNLYINVGDERPTANSYDFIFKSVGHDTIFNLTKSDILQKCQQKDIFIPSEGSIKNIHLVIGIWTENIQTIYSVYAMKIHLAHSLDIYHVRSDQKVLCKPRKTNTGNYTCLYAVIFDGLDTISQLSIVPRSQDSTDYLKSYANFIEVEYVEKNDYEYLEAHIPNETAEYTSDKVTKPYIYMDRVLGGHCLYIRVISDNDNIIELLTSTSTFDKEIVPNPSTVQLFSVKDKRLTLDFETNKNLLINVVSVAGDGDAFWEDDAGYLFYLHGIDDRCSLTSGTQNLNASNKLIFESFMNDTDPNNPGFMFYISYYPRTGEYNCDLLSIGKSTEFNYRSSDFPINFVVPLKDLQTEVYASFNFYGFRDDKSRERWFTKDDLIKIWATVITEEDANRVRFSINNQMEKPSKVIEGIFDGALNVGIMPLSVFDLMQFEHLKDKNPYLYISLEKNDGIKFIFDKITTEVTVLQESKVIAVTEKVYQYGRIGYDLDTMSMISTYILNINQNKQYMRIQFAANSDQIDWAVSEKEGSRINMTFSDFTAKYVNGKSIVTFKVPDTVKEELFLSVFPKGGKDSTDPRLGNYVFKYMNAYRMDEFQEYRVSDTKIQVEQVSSPSGNKGYSITVNAVPNSELFKTSYVIKGISQDKYLEGELLDTIAITHSKGFNLQVDYPAVENNKVNIAVNEIDFPIKYITVLAKIKDKSINEFVAYKPVDPSNPDTTPTEPDDQPAESTTIQYNGQKINKEYKDAIKKQKYLVTFSNDVPNFIEITTESNNYPGQILYFSPTDPNCMNNREQLVKSSGDKKVTMWVSKKQFNQGNNKLYFAVQCQNIRGSCSYKLSITGVNEISIGSNFNYNYYVSSTITEQKFKVQLPENDSPYVSFIAKGSNSTDLSITTQNVEIYKYKFNLGTAMIIKVPLRLKGNYIDVYVKANQGDYISVTCNEISGNQFSQGDLLRPNGDEISGYLKRGVLENTCYKLNSLNSNENKGISIVYITGVIFDKIAEIYLKDSNSEQVSGSDTLVETGSTFFKYELGSEGRDISVCVRIPNNDRFTLNQIVYSLHVMGRTENIASYNNYSPQINGIIYPRVIPKGSTVFFSGVRSNVNTDDVTYNMLNIIGFPKMVIAKCETFPDCDYNDDDILMSDKIIRPHDINRMTTWTTRELINSPISPKQNLIVVKCLGGSDDETDYCIFETSIFGNNDEINLIEKEPMSQFVLKGEKDHFVIDFSKENRIKKVYLDTMILSGDVGFNLVSEQFNQINYHKYYLANKIFFSVSLNDNIGLKKIKLEVTASTNAYYELETRIVREDIEQSINKINSGMSYLVSIDTLTKRKNIQIYNLRVGEKNTYLTTFNSLNCKFNITRFDQSQSSPSRKKISLYDNYAQEVLNQYEKDYKTGIYNYTIEVLENDKSIYNNKMCMLYVSGFEATTIDSLVQREIVVSENVPQRVIFENGLKKVRYLYPHANSLEELVIDFKAIDYGNYSMGITYNYNGTEKKQYYTASETNYISQKKLKTYCKENELCSIVVEITLEEKLSEEDPMIEFTIRQVKNIPAYLPKGVVKKDFVVNTNYLYLYTDVGQYDQGYVMVDFARGSGKVFGKVVKKDSQETNPNWRTYSMPTSIDESLKYDVYTKKLTIEEKDTRDCKSGCYLLLSIQSSISGEFDENYRFYPISIVAYLTPNVNQLITLEAEEYVVGSLNLYKEGSINEYYQIWLPNDAEKVEFDWQSDVADLYVFVGNEIKNKEEADFTLLSKWGDTIHTLNKTDILSKVNRNNLVSPDSIKYVSLILGIGSNISDSVGSNIYSFKVHLPMKKKIELDIHKIDSDHKTLCRPQKIKDGEYRCLFIVKYNFINLFNNLLVYSESQDKTATTYMYANFIDKKIYETYDVEKLKENIPTDENSTYNNKKEGIIYLFVNVPDFDKFLYVSVVSDKAGIQEFLSTFYTFDKRIQPNPSTKQLFSVTKEAISFPFHTTKDLLINIFSIAGSGKIYWENSDENIYYLRGRDDKLSIASKTQDPLHEGTLVIENITPKNEDQDSKDKMAKPGFAFYISYSLRPSNINFDEIYSGKTIEMGYRKADLPLFLYSKLSDINYDLSVSINFRVMQLENRENKRILKSDDFSVDGAIIQEQKVYQIKKSPLFRPDYTTKGIFDPAIKTVMVFLSKKNINDFKIRNEEKPTLYFGMDRKNNNISNFDKFNAEVSIIRENEGVPTTEKLYQYGKIGGDDINVYRLKFNQRTELMRVQFSKNSENVGFSINVDKGKKENSTDLNLERMTRNGIEFITFKRPKDKEYVYLNVFAKKTDGDKRLNNYAFKYINSQKGKFFMYDVYKNQTNLTKEYIKNDTTSTKTLKVTFNKINNTNASVTYSLRYVPNDKYIYGESHQTIAVTESPSIVSQVIDPQPDSEGKITLELANVKENPAIIQVIAQVMDGVITEYVCYDGFYQYDGKKSNENEEGGKRNKVPKVLIFAIGIGLLVIIIALFVAIVCFHTKNKDLMDQVSKISFVDSKAGERKEDANLLLNDNQNELE